MNYKKIYDSIIENRKRNILLYSKDLYTENHHIIPRSIGGSDEKSNLIRLTAREHFVCHCLLSKLYDKETNELYKMNYAFMMMKSETLNQVRYFNSHLYNKSRKELSLALSKKYLSFFGNKYTKELYIDFITNYDVDTYDLFKVKYEIKCNFKNFLKNVKKYTQYEIKCYKVGNKPFYNKMNAEKYEKELKIYYTKLYDIWLNTSKDDFVKKTNYEGRLSNLSLFFKKYVDDYKPKNRKFK